MDHLGREQTPEQEVKAVKRSGLLKLATASAVSRTPDTMDIKLR